MFELKFVAIVTGAQHQLQQRGGAAHQHPEAALQQHPGGYFWIYRTSRYIHKFLIQ